MTLRTYLLAGLLVVATGCSIELQHDLTEQDANDIYVLLTNNGISAVKLKVEGGNELRFLITVPKGDAAQAAQLLRTNSLPRPHADGLSIFAKSKGMVPTQTEERAMLLEALGGEVSNALNQIDGVLEARVIVMIPENNDLAQPDNKPMPSASVFLKYRFNRENRPPISPEDIRKFVATAVPEMRPEAVTVLMTQAALPSAEVGEAGRLQDVLGLRMTASSASQFKWLAAGASLLILAMAAFSTWNVMRGSATPKRARARSPEA